MKRKTLILIASTLLLIISACASIGLTTTLVSIGDGIIRDTDDDLEWIDHTFKSRTWAGATSDADALTFSNMSDWRLPTKTELLTLVVTTNTPKIDSLFSLGPVGNWSCWSSDTVPINTLRSEVIKTRAYLVFFGDGRAFHAPKQSHHASLYVRDYEETSFQWNNGDYILWNDGTTITANGL